MMMLACVCLEEMSIQGALKTKWKGSFSTMVPHLRSARARRKSALQPPPTAQHQRYLCRPADDEPEHEHEPKPKPVLKIAPEPEPSTSDKGCEPTSSTVPVDLLVEYEGKNRSPTLSTMAEEYLMDF